MLHGKSASSNVTDLSHSITASHAKQVRELPKYQLDVVVNSLREGIRPTQISYYFGEQGWLNVTEKTFTQYVQAFRRMYPEMIGQNDDEMHLDHYVDPRNPHLDEEAILEQAIRMQKIRLGIGLKFEKETGLMNRDLHRDVNTMNTMVETLAKMRGRMMGAGRPSSDSLLPIANDAKEALRTSEHAEIGQTKLASLFDRLGGLLDQKKQQDAAS